MKNTYLSAVRWARKPHLRFLLLLLLALPFVGRAQTFTVTPSDPATPQSFGQVAVGTSSSAKSYTVVGSGFTMPVFVALGGAGAGTQYEISRDNATFSGAAISLAPDVNGNINTIVYARFRPTAVGTFNNRTLAFSSDQSSDFFQYTLNGSGTPGTPTVSADPTSRNFGTQIVNTPSAPQTTVVSGTSLTGIITVAAPAGFQVSTSSTSGFGASLNLTPVNGSVAPTTVYIRFLPTAAQTYNSNVTVSSQGATTVNVGVAGTGTLPPPALTVTPQTLADFGQVTVGSSSTAIRSFTVGGNDLQGPVTITPPAGFRIRTGNNFFSTGAITLTPTNGTLANTTIDVRFNPTAVQSYASDITVASTNAASQAVRVTGQGTPSSGDPVLSANPSVLDFGVVTSSGATGTRSFEVSGTDLDAAIVLTPSVGNIEIRNASAGGSFSKNPLSISPINGTVASQIIEVRLVSLIAAGPFNERINVTSEGATSTLVSVTANNTSGAISDISVSNPNGNEFTFVTRPTTESVSQSYLLAGTNLIDALVVQPIGPNAAYFQVSADNVNFVSRLSFTPDNQGNVTQRPIYVRFVPGVNAVTATADIRNSSAPAPNFDVSVTGISEPTIRLDRAIGSFPDNIVKGTQSSPTTVRLDGFLLAGNVDIQFPNENNPRNPAGTPQFEFSLDGGATYVKSASITPDGEGNFTRNVLVRFAPTRVGNAAQELLFTNASFFNGTSFALTSGFGRTTGFSIATEPTVQSTASIVRSSDGTSATITFDLSNPPAGTSYGQNRLVIGSSTYQQLPTSLFPRDKQNFNPGTTINGAYQYGSGTPIETSSNTYVVFSAASDNFTIANLNPALTYYFYSFEFNNDGVLNAENYRVPNNEPQTPLPVELVSFTANLRNNGVVLNWATASETNNSGFEVQRSSDAKSFTTVLFKAGAGNAATRTAYEAVDAKPMPGVSYYRLKQIDTDGKASYSKTLVVKAKLSDVSVYPNPTAGNNVVTVALPSGSTEGLLVTITDLSGRKIRESRLGSQGDLNVQDLQAGTYIVVVGEGDAKVSRKLIKN